MIENVAVRANVVSESEPEAKSELEFESEDESKSESESRFKSDKIFQSASAKLLSRAIPSSDLRLQTEQVAKVEQAIATDLCSVLIFRLGIEWLALPAKICQQVLPSQVERRLPHRSNATLLGIVNVRGQLLLKVSLLPALRIANLKEKAALTAGATANKSHRRMVVVSVGQEAGTADTWAFDADEVYGIQSVSLSDLQPVAAGSAAANACTRSLFDWQKRRVSFLDDVKLFELVKSEAL